MKENRSTAEQLNKKIIFTGGGSGGHISAAMAIIQGLRSKYPNLYENILYIGGNLPMEGEEGSESLDEKIIGKTEIPFRSIRAGKLQRYFSWRTVTLLFGVIGGFFDAIKEIKNFKPDMIISTGGYVTVPVCFAGWIKKIPIYIHEQTAAVGLTNKIVGKFAKRVYLSFEQSKEYFNKNKTVLVGNAVRPDIFKKDGFGETVDAVRTMLPNKEKLPIILVSGGGQGSHLLNITLRQMLRYLVEEYQVILQTGDNKVNNDHEMLNKERNKLPEKCRDRLHVTKFINSNEIGMVFDSIDLYIGRSGANSVYEMAVLRKPSIFIPIPWVTHNEQYKNAKTLEEMGLAVILPEGEVNADRLNSEIRKIFNKIKTGKLSIDSKKLSERFPLDAVDRIIADLPL